MMTYSEEIRELVKVRLMSTPPDIKISIGGFGEFTGQQLVEEVDKGTAAGDAAIRMEILFLRKMPTLSRTVSESG